MVAIELSDKALKLIELRRKGRTHGQYVNLIIENLADTMISAQTSTFKINLFDILESGGIKPPQPAPAADAASSGRALEVLKQMKATYSEKVPYNMFYQECVDRGVTQEEVEAVVQKNRGQFQFQINRDDEYSKILLVIIYNYLKDIFGKSMSASQFYGKCLEECLTVEDLRYAENAWQVSIPDVETLRSLAEKTDTMSVENKLLKILYGLKKDHPDTIATAQLYNACNLCGLTKEDIGQLEKIYTRYQLTRHNQRMSMEKKDKQADTGKVKVINAKFNQIIETLQVVNGENIPEAVFAFKCKEVGLTGEEQLYMKRLFEEYQESLTSFKEIKYMNNKAYIILTALRKTYPGKIPYNVFYNKCKAIGLKPEEISEAIKRSGRIIATEKSDEEHYLQVLDDILTDIKKPGSS